MIPRIVLRKIIKNRKPSGLIQYGITLPKDYAMRLEARGVDSLLIVYDHGLGAFPSTSEQSEMDILTFMKTHPEFAKIFTEASDQHATEAGGK